MRASEGLGRGKRGKERRPATGGGHGRGAVRGAVSERADRRGGLDSCGDDGGRGGVSCSPLPGSVGVLAAPPLVALLLLLPPPRLLQLLQRLQERPYKGLDRAQAHVGCLAPLVADDVVLEGADGLGALRPRGRGGRRRRSGGDEREHRRGRRERRRSSRGRRSRSCCGVRSHHRHRLGLGGDHLSQKESEQA